MKHKFLLLTIAILGLFTVSCNDWLEVQPEMQQKEEDMFSSYKGFRNALTGCYIAMTDNSVYGQQLLFTDIESLASQWDIQEQSGVNYFLMNHDYNDVVRSSIQSIYSKLFNIIVQVNKVITYAETNKDVFPSESMRSIILGEAYALRAYCQLDVLRLFGEVPNGSGEKVSLPYSEVKAFDERATYYDFAGYTAKLIQDLKQAEQLLEDNDPLFNYTFAQLNIPKTVDSELGDSFLGYRQSRLNYYAVKALQARAYLYMGKKDEAYAAAKVVIEAKDKNGKPMMSLSGVTDREKKMLLCPNECLFYLSKRNIKTAASILAGGTQSTEKSSLFIRVSRLEELFPTDKESDLRYMAGWNKEVKVNGFNSYCGTIRKYHYEEDAVSDATLYYEILPMLRMSEVYMIAIETTPSLEEANRLYGEYLLKGCGVLLNGDAFAEETKRTDILLPEFRREFFAEGQMFYAYKRLGASKMLWNTAEIADEDYVLWNCVNTKFNP